ncbi:PEGA domain-containing protein [bacterium]|nr:PEGA domain-containing protein [bacterium]MBU1984612.1 PEGA domain-containing protein [bacterium]
MAETRSDTDIQARRRAVLGMILAGLGMVLAVLWGLWAFLHNQTGVLIVTSRPSGAEVILNRRPTDLLTTAFLSDLPADSFIVSLRKDGYRPIPPTQGVSVQPNETTRVTFLLAPLVRGDDRPLPPVSGKARNWQWRIVRIASDPDSAAIILDDKPLGVRTPVTVLLESGLHHLQACWPDGRKAFKNIIIDENQSPPDLIMRPVTYEKFVRPNQETEP